MFKIHSSMDFIMLSLNKSTITLKCLLFKFSYSHCSIHCYIIHSKIFTKMYMICALLCIKGPEIKGPYTQIISTLIHMLPCDMESALGKIGMAC